MIDLWDIATYDSDMMDHLESHKGIINGYFDLERRKDIMVATLATWQPIQPNQFAGDYMSAVEGFGRIMSSKTLRAFHYTRMTDEEVEAILSDGITPASVEFLKQRVDRQVSAGRLTKEQGEKIVAHNRLYTTDFGVRGVFWATTLPHHPDDSAVSPLVSHWGCESAYQLLTGRADEDLIALLRGIGRGRVVEIAVPLQKANGGLAGFGVATNAVREYARSLGYEVYSGGHDLNIEQPLPASNVLRIHTEGDEDYKAFGAR
jgi:hypothetical protein